MAVSNIEWYECSPQVAEARRKMDEAAAALQQAIENLYPLEAQYQRGAVIEINQLRMRALEVSATLRKREPMQATPFTFPLRIR